MPSRLDVIEFPLAEQRLVQGLGFRDAEIEGDLLVQQAEMDALPGLSGGRDYLRRNLYTIYAYPLANMAKFGQ